jgi:hypothetical protein
MGMLRARRLRAQQDQRHRRHQQRKERKVHEDIDIGQQRRLPHDNPADVVERGRRCDCGRDAVRRQCRRRVRDRLLIGRRRRHQMIGEIVLVDLRAARDDRGRRRNADAAAEIAGDIDERRGLAGPLRRQPCIGRRRDRNEDERPTRSSLASKNCLYSDRLLEPELSGRGTQIMAIFCGTLVQSTTWYLHSFTCTRLQLPPFAPA